MEKYPFMSIGTQAGIFSSAIASLSYFRLLARSLCTGTFLVHKVCLHQHWVYQWTPQSHAYCT